MQTRLAKLLERVSDWGTAEAPSPQCAKRIRLTNRLSLLACVLMGLWLVGDLITEAPAGSVVTSLVSFAATILPLAASRLGYHLAARNLLVLVVNAVVFAGAILYQHDAGGAMVLIPLAGLPLMVYELENRRSIAFGSLLPVALFVVSEARALLFPPFPTIATQPWAYAANVALAFVGSFVVVLHFHLENRRAERRLAESLEETRLNQVKLVQASKMSALGQMAAAIAHEVKNPLVVICGNASLLKKQLAEPGRAQPEAAELAARIESTGFRIGRIVSALQGFARDGSSDPMREIPIARIVGETLELCRERFLRSGIDLRSSPVTAELQGWGRAVQLSQVLLNLLNNACDAVAAGGTDERWVEVRALDAGTAIEIEVMDSGPGVPEALRQRIMEPFFTTKPPGQGTGLGLSLSKSLVEQSGGTLRLDADSARTRFVVSWPKAPSAAASRSPA